jgi:DNA-binding PadR family transcriptional regulator
MTRRFSAQTVSVLAALCAEPSRWRHGYDVASETGLRAGTLYPILARLADRGLLDACWEQEQPAGRPRRHMYRLSSDGLAQARAAVADAPVLARRAAARRAAAGRRAAAPGRRELAGERA